MAGNLSLDRSADGLDPPSTRQYFPFWRKILETVLRLLSVRTTPQHLIGYDARHLLSTINLAKGMSANSGTFTLEHLLFEHTPNLALLDRRILFMIHTDFSSLVVGQRPPPRRRCVHCMASDRPRCLGKSMRSGKNQRSKSGLACQKVLVCRSWYHGIKREVRWKRRWYCELETVVFLYGQLVLRPIVDTPLPIRWHLVLLTITLSYFHEKCRHLPSIVVEQPSLGS